jgi:hypothetical protein
MLYQHRYVPHILFGFKNANAGKIFRERAMPAGQGNAWRGQAAISLRLKDGV